VIRDDEQNETTAGGIIAAPAATTTPTEAPRPRWRVGLLTNRPDAPADWPLMHACWYECFVATEHGRRGDVRRPPHVLPLGL
jgi:hypothetical protein